MINLEKIDGMVRNLRRYVGYLHEIAQTDEKDFLSDPTKLGAARYYLQISIETCLNMGTHIISAERFRAPKDYRDVFTILNEEGILPDEFTATLRRMAGFRNRLVHLYWEIDDVQIYAYLQDQLGDFDSYVHYILLFVQQKQADA